jgi:hypothetical protein
MTRPTRPVAVLIALVVLARAGAGCTQTYDGSESFYEQHPEYKDQPSYMHPSDPDDTPDNQSPRPW